MDGLGGDDAGDIFPQGVAHQHFAGNQRVPVPAAQLQKTQSTVGLDGLNDETHFVGMGIDHQHGLTAGIFLPVDVKIPQEILPDLTDGFRPAAGHLHHFIFKAGCAGGIGKLLKHFQGFGMDLHRSSSLVVRKIRDAVSLRGMGEKHRGAVTYLFHHTIWPGKINKK